MATKDMLDVDKCKHTSNCNKRVESGILKVVGLSSK